MNSRKNIALGLIAVLAFTFLTACSKDKASTESITTDQSSSTIIGKVTEINGTIITLALGEMPGGGPGKDGGAMPSGAPDGNGKHGGHGKGGGAIPSGTPDRNGKDGGPGKDGGTMPSGTPDGNGKDDGNLRDQEHGGMNRFFKETGETKAIEVTDESLIKLMSADGETTGGLKDISVDSILTVQYAEDGTTISAIIVHSNSDNAAAPDNQDKSSF
jgi:hypothetical protein